MANDDWGGVRGGDCAAARCGDGWRGFKVTCCNVMGTRGYNNMETETAVRALGLLSLVQAVAHHHHHLRRRLDRSPLGETDFTPFAAAPNRGVHYTLHKSISYVKRPDDSQVAIKPHHGDVSGWKE
mmetsp:Transcript_3136/g.11342  ORF Transcript_3136/g.11342 Transcript_3136/m.11342 type:complete len:126 (+) Transcript_3136:570-947(+)